MPNDRNAEMAVIGALIMDAERAFDIVSDEKIDGSHFYSMACSEIFESVVSIGRSCDMIQLCDDLKKNGRLDSVGGIEFVTECADLCFVSYLERHCGILKDKLHRRKIIMAAQEAIDNCGKESEPIEIAASLGAVAVEISDVERSIDKHEIIANSLELFENAHKGIVSGVPMPWEEFSRNVGGIQRRCVCPLLGRDGAGKSFLVSKMLAFLGQKNIPALSIPFEDGADRQMRRIAGCIGGYSTGELERGYYCDANGSFRKMDDSMFESKKQAAEKYLSYVAKMPVFFEDNSMTAEQIRIVAGKYRRKHGIQILFIDGVKDVIPSKGENGTKQEEHISRILVQTAKELDIAVVPVCHLTDIPEDVKIQRRNMRGAKSQFHNARQVLIYQNAGIESAHHIIDENTVALHMEKNNYGRESMIFLQKDFDHCDFTEARKFSY